jgi:peptidoglycan hydrolase-like protein with peptidoglycan-binding domain
VQRRLTGLGFDTKATGQFDQSTRAVITRWQAARGYPNSGYLNKLQHKALLTEIVAVAPTASSDEERPKRRAPSQAQSQPQQAPPQRQHAPGPDPAGAGRFIGGVVGGMLR